MNTLTAKMEALQTEARREMDAFNKPHSFVVAINCVGIGDDNDYSCFLRGAWIALFLADHKEMALTLANTDPMLCKVLTMEELETEVARHSEYLKEEKQTQELYYKLYRD